MSAEQNLLQNDIEYLNMMFKVSTIANQTDNIYELLKNIHEYTIEQTKGATITIYHLESNNQNYKCVCTNDKIRINEYFEFEDANSPFWDAVNQSKIIAMRDINGNQLFKTFLEHNNLLSLDPSFLRVFYYNDVPICFCFIKENSESQINSKVLENLNHAYNYLEPIIGKFHKKVKKDEEIAQLQKSLHNISILYNISQAVNFIDDLKRLLQVIIQKALITLDAEKGSLMLYDYSINALQVRIVSGLQDKKLEEAINNGAVQCAKIEIGEGIAGTVFLERKPIITNLGSADPRFIVKEVLSNTKSLLCVPLVAKGEVIGVINITNKKYSIIINR